MPRPSSNRPTLRTIADLSGLAIPTVSRALNDAPDIGAKTKEKVREIARQIGYIPNRAGVRLRTGKTNVVALVISTDSDVTDHTGKLISSIAFRLRETPYHMIVTPYFPQEDPMKPVRYLVETGSADALILNQIEPEDSRIAYLMERKVPFASYGRTQWCGQHPYFDFDNHSYGVAAARGLLDAGRRNLLLLAPPMTQSYALHMVAGIRSVCDPAGLDFAIMPNVTSDHPGELLRAEVARHLAENPEIDGIICASSTSAISATVGAEMAGRTLGQSIDVFAKEALPFLSFFRPEMMTVVEDVREAGSFLAEAVIQAVERPDLPPKQKLETARMQNYLGA